MLSHCFRPNSYARIEKASRPFRHRLGQEQGRAKRVPTPSKDNRKQQYLIFDSFVHSARTYGVDPFPTHPSGRFRHLLESLPRRSFVALPVRYFQTSTIASPDFDTNLNSDTMYAS